MNKWLKNIGYNLPYYFLLLLTIILFIQAIPTLEMDMWGYDSIYMHKVMLLALGTQVFYNAGSLRTPKALIEVIKRYAFVSDKEK